jgi:prevent-host-death family protein
MIAIGMRELKEKTRSVIDRVREGEEVNLTYRGKVIAHIVPAQRTIKQRKKLSAAWMTMDDLAGRISTAAKNNARDDWRREL